MTKIYELNSASFLKKKPTVWVDSGLTTSELSIHHYMALPVLGIYLFTHKSETVNVLRSLKMCALLPSCYTHVDVEVLTLV